MYCQRPHKTRNVYCQAATTIHYHTVPPLQSQLTAHYKALQQPLPLWMPGPELQQNAHAQQCQHSAQDCV